MKLETPETKNLEGNGIVPASASPLSGKALAKQRDRFALHVALIMHQDGVPKARATFQAWLEGVEGVEKRLTPAPST